MWVRVLVDGRWRDVVIHGYQSYHYGIFGSEAVQVLRQSTRLKGTPLSWRWPAGFLLSEVLTI